MGSPADLYATQPKLLKESRTWAVGLLALVPLAGTALYLRTHWQQFPARWPRHWNAAGQVNGWGTRSFAGAVAPLAFGAGLVLVFSLMTLMMSHAPGPDAVARRRAGAPLALMAWVFGVATSGLAVAPLVYPQGAGAMLLILGVALVGVLAAVVWMLVRSGFLNADGQAPPTPASSPDSSWHLGVFYYNPADAAVLVPKRFGLGWTLNFARPIAWVFLGLILALPLGGLALSLLRHTR